MSFIGNNNFFSQPDREPIIEVNVMIMVTEPAAMVRLAGYQVAQSPEFSFQNNAFSLSNDNAAGFQPNLEGHDLYVYDPHAQLPVLTWLPAEIPLSPQLETAGPIDWYVLDDTGTLHVFWAGEDGGWNGPLALGNVANGGSAPATILSAAFQ